MSARLHGEQQSTQNRAVQQFTESAVSDVSMFKLVARNRTQNRAINMIPWLSSHNVWIVSMTLSSQPLFPDPASVRLNCEHEIKQSTYIPCRHHYIWIVSTQPTYIPWFRSCRHQHVSIGSTKSSSQPLFPDSAIVDILNLEYDSQHEIELLTRICSSLNQKLWHISIGSTKSSNQAIKQSSNQAIKLYSQTQKLPVLACLNP